MVLVQLCGKRIQESARSTRKTLAREAERQRRRELEQAINGLPAEQARFRIRSVSEVVKLYLETYGATHTPKALQWSTDRLAHVKRLMSSVSLPDLTEDRIRRYIGARRSEGVGNRTVNMEMAELSRAIGKTWKVLWPKVKKLDEPKDITAVQISWAEQRRLLKTREKASPKGCSGDQVAALDKIEIMLLSQLGLHSRQ